MANKVFANGREIACKSGSGKVIAAMPDVCLSPPSPPAGPVPIPYPVTSMASDTDAGSKHVKITGKPVMLKDQSNFKKCTGDEASTKSLGMGVVTHKNTGKVFFISWSMDVKLEGENAVRHMDMATSNHGSTPGNTPPFIYKDGMGGGGIIGDCKGDAQKAETACQGKKTRKAQCKDKACRDAKKCLLVSYSQGKRKGKKSTVGCCPGEQPHHLIEAHGFCKGGDRGTPLTKFKKYDIDAAPCVCAKGGRYEREHGAFHALVGMKENAAVARDIKDGGTGDEAWKYKDARKAAVNAHKSIFPDSACSKDCLEAQLNKYHKKRCGVSDNDDLRTGTQPLQDWQKQGKKKVLQTIGVTAATGP